MEKIDNITQEIVQVLNEQSQAINDLQQWMHLMWVILVVMVVVVIVIVVTVDRVNEKVEYDELKEPLLGPDTEEV
jgi:hypothetical protein